MREEMTREECRSIIEEVWGSRGQRRAAKDIGKGEVTVSRWLYGVSPIGKTEALLLRLILILHRKQHGWRRWVRDYLEGKPEAKKRLEDLL